jgi:hypothetical protein
MKTQYVYIDSNHRRSHETDSKITVNLSTPLEHCKSVTVESFSCPNEFDNIREESSFLTFKHYRIYPAPANVPVYDQLCTVGPIPNGLYSMEALCTALNEISAEQKSAESANANPKRPTFTFTLLADKKIQITLEKVAGAYSSRYTLYSPDDTDFTQTMAHRIGFTRDQVANDHFNLIWDGVNNSTDGVTYNEAVVYSRKGTTTAKETPERTYVASSKSNTVKIWTTYAPVGMVGFQKTHTSKFIGFESISGHLFLKSDLVTDFVGTFLQNDQLLTTQINCLQKIDINVNIYSYIHYRSGNANSWVHQLNGKTISNFTIELTNDIGKTFANPSFKDFSCVLKFEMEENDSSIDLNEQSIINNLKSQFMSRHNC